MIGREVSPLLGLTAGSLMVGSCGAGREPWVIRANQLLRKCDETSDIITAAALLTTSHRHRYFLSIFTTISCVDRGQRLNVTSLSFYHINILNCVVILMMSTKGAGT